MSSSFHYHTFFTKEQDETYHRPPRPQRRRHRGWICPTRRPRHICRPWRGCPRSQTRFLEAYLSPTFAPCRQSKKRSFSSPVRFAFLAFLHKSCCITKYTETHVRTSGLYPDKTLYAWTYGLGNKGSFGTNGFFKVEGYLTDYDTFSATSTTDKTVNANLDVVGAALKLGYKF